MSRHALAEALRLDPTWDDPVVGANVETLGVEGAAVLLKTTPRAIYVRHQRGQMPRPITKRPLVWRKADLLASGK